MSIKLLPNREPDLNSTFTDLEIIVQSLLVASKVVVPLVKYALDLRASAASPAMLSARVKTSVVVR